MSRHSGTHDRPRMHHALSAKAGMAWLALAATLACAPLLAQQGPAATVQPGDAAMGHAPMDPPGIVLLPMRFKAMQSQVGTLETVPDWTEAARTTLAQELRALVSARRDMQVVALPDLDADERLRIDEHLRLARAIVDQSDLYQRRPWKARRGDFDRSVGEGLSFLRERTGADYALMVDGLLVVPTGGVRFMSFMMPGTVIPGADYVQLMLVRLDTGQVTWFNTTITVNDPGLFGHRFKDLREPRVARDVLARLLSAYPKTPALAQ